METMEAERAGSNNEADVLPFEEKRRNLLRFKAESESQKNVMLMKGNDTPKIKKKQEALMMHNFSSEEPYKSSICCNCKGISTREKLRVHVIPFKVSDDRSRFCPVPWAVGKENIVTSGYLPGDDNRITVRF